MKKSLFVSSALLLATTLTSCGSKALSKQEFLAECAKFEQIAFNTDIKVTMESSVLVKDEVTDSNFTEFHLLMSEKKEGGYDLNVNPESAALAALGTMIIYLAFSMPLITEETFKEVPEEAGFYSNPYKLEYKGEEGDEKGEGLFTWDKNGALRSMYTVSVTGDTKSASETKYEFLGDTFKINKEDLDK
ncbi:MAG: hypothetical protein MJ239_01540 [Bacilli bacterium]|nr:hypothetical protein [Bacilli bacterium]